MKTCLRSLALFLVLGLVSVRADWVLVLRDISYGNGYALEGGDVKQGTPTENGWLVKNLDGTASVLPRDGGRIISGDEAATRLFAVVIETKTALGEAFKKLPPETVQDMVMKLQELRAKRMAADDAARSSSAVPSKVRIENELKLLRRELQLPNRTEKEIREINDRISFLEQQTR